jgi:hypothetical protein
MAKIMIHVGSLIARQIDSFVSNQIKTYPKSIMYFNLDLLENIMSAGTGHIGRLLHYFPYDAK